MLTFGLPIISRSPFSGHFAPLEIDAPLIASHLREFWHGIALNASIRGGARDGVVEYQ